METYTVVRSEHLNHSGHLFGGQMLHWVDECGWLAATRDFPLCTFVTRAMSDVQFRNQVPNGAVLRLVADAERVGHTSVTYSIRVYCTPRGSASTILVFSTSITLVNIDDRGEKCPLPHAPPRSPSPL